MRNLRRVAGLGAALSGVALVILPGPVVRRALREQVERLARVLRFASDRLHGFRYRLAGRRPAPDVADDVLADRIRSTIGPLEKCLDVPRIHVMVEDHVALLHGVVATEDQTRDLQRAVARVSGVVGVESYLHVGLGRGDTRPSVGAQAPHESDAMRRILEGAEAAGVSEDLAPMAARVVLGTFAERLPAAEREHVAAHLPADVRALFTPPIRTHALPAPRTVNELVARVATALGAVPHDRARDATGAVLRVLATVVPDEADDVTAVLPPELRSLWTGDESAPATTSS